MSRAFVKEGDQEEVPVIPPRAALPPGVTNYVTPYGLQQLLTELDDLQRQKDELALENETEQRIASTVLTGRMHRLQERIASAVVLNPDDFRGEAVRFGATVTLKVVGKNQTQKFQIVGVDEADVQKQKIAFVAPIAVAIIGKEVGEVAELHLGKEVRRLEVKEINW